MEVVDARDELPVVVVVAPVVAPVVELPPAVVEAAVVAVVEPPAGALVETPWPTQAVLARKKNMVNRSCLFTSRFQ